MSNTTDAAAISAPSGNTSLYITNSHVTGNHGAAYGAIAVEGTVSVSDSHFADNMSSGTSSMGAAINAQAPSPVGEAKVAISGSEFSGNQAELAGGAIYVSGMPTKIVSASSLHDNEVVGTGGTGGAVAGSNSAVQVLDSTFTSNTADTEIGRAHV